MTEEEWLSCANPSAMFLAAGVSPVISSTAPQQLVSDRKLRLFTCACIRTVWHRLADDRLRRVVEAGERLADGELSYDEVLVVRRSAQYNVRDFTMGIVEHGAVRTCSPNIAAVAATWATAVTPAPAQADLLREIVGNQFSYWPWGGRKPMPQWPDDFPWLSPQASSLARVAYAVRDAATGRLDQVTLSALADALEENGASAPEPGRWHRCHGCDEVFPAIHKYSSCNSVGCDGEDSSPAVKHGTHPIVAHLRSPGPHVRGCWALDLVLGKG